MRRVRLAGDQRAPARQSTDVWTSGAVRTVDADALDQLSPSGRRRSGPHQPLLGNVAMGGLEPPT
ncbi:MAG: hypothetical protein D6824_05895 [Planctomycetota bacterium]|nr:MAG: hypothetical protein D6824_05895 [Planctomycetota bacterium]